MGSKPFAQGLILQPCVESTEIPWLGQVLWDHVQGLLSFWTILWAWLERNSE